MQCIAPDTRVAVSHTVDDGAIAAVHGALGVDGRGQEAVRAAADGMSELGGGQGGQDAGSSGGGGARRDEAMIPALESGRSENGVGQDAGQQIIRPGGGLAGLQRGAERSL